MDLVTLFRAKLTILHCSLGTFTRQWASVNNNYYTDREMLVISTYFNDNAQTSLGWFVIDILYNHVCNKYNDKSIWWYLNCKPCIASTIQGAINSDPSSTTLSISINGVLWQWVFLSYSYACKNGSREPKHAPFRDYLSSI